MESGTDYASLAAFYKTTGMNPGISSGSEAGEDGGDEGDSGPMG